MRLDHLYTSKSSRTLMEESSQPLESSRYHPINRFMQTDTKPAIQMKNELAELDRLARRDPARAYRQLRQLIDRDITTGLKGRAEYSKIMGESSNELSDNGLPQQIVIAADVDNMAHMNEKSGLGTSGVNSILKYIGELFENRFGSAQDVGVYRNGSDSFAVTIFIGDKDIGQAQATFVDALSRCIWISNR